MTMCTEVVEHFGVDLRTGYSLGGTGGQLPWIASTSLGDFFLWQRRSGFHFRVAELSRRRLGFTNVQKAHSGGDIE